ncbi:MAG TPA: hypothetical protein VKG61_08655, partial [Streptosporangiaceae bacterium]|nr:hypothetical protein [Streptosporangiaceae bacterium]
MMGGLALSGVRYDRYLRFVAPLLGILVLTCLAMLLGGAVPALGGPVKYMDTNHLRRPRRILLAVAGLATALLVGA